MNRALTLTLKDLRTFCQLDGEKRHKYLVEPEKNFTRKRKLFFDRTVGLVMRLLKKVWQ